MGPSDLPVPKRRAAAFAHAESGAAILEFALALPILLILIAGCCEVGRAMLVYHAMTEAVRGGARYLARVPNPTCTPDCSLGASRAVAMTRDLILENTRLDAKSVRASPSPGSPDGTVAMTVEVTLGADLLAWLGLDPVLRLRATHQEARVAE